jgi:glycosyltransferase involved in cell wall biosynthesis
MNDGCTFSIIIPFYNAERTIKRALDSVLSQSNKDWELLCIDDGSTDNGYSIVQKYAIYETRLRLLYQDNEGPASARANGIRNSEGSYIVFLDADDYLASNYLSEIAKEIKTEADVFIPELMSEQKPGKFESFNAYFGLVNGMTLTGIQAFRRTFPWSVHGFACYRKDLMLEHATGAITKINKFNADELITRKIFLNSDLVTITNGQYFHTKNQESLTKKMSLHHLGFVETERRLFEFCYDHDPGWIDKVFSSSVKKCFDVTLRFVWYKSEFKPDEWQQVCVTLKEWHKDLRGHGSVFSLFKSHSVLWSTLFCCFMININTVYLIKVMQIIRGRK